MLERRESLGLVAAFEWLVKPYRATRVHMPDAMLTETYSRVNGRQETPVLIREDGSVLTETMAIARWLELRDDEHRISFAAGSAEAHRMHQFIGTLTSWYEDVRRIPKPTLVALMKLGAKVARFVPVRAGTRVSND